MELSSCLDCKELAGALRVHVKMVKEARQYITDTHAGELRDITPLEALQEQALYYENVLDDQDESINDLETEIEKQDKEIKNLKFLLEGTKISLKDERAQSKIQMKYIIELKNRMDYLQKVE